MRILHENLISFVFVLRFLEINIFYIVLNAAIIII